MKFRHLTYTLAGSLALLMHLSGCGDKIEANGQNSSGQTEQTERLFGSTSRKQIIGRGETAFFIKLQSPSSWSLQIEPAQASEWIRLGKTSGNATSEEGIPVSISSNAGGERSALIIAKAGNNVSDTISIVQQIGEETPPIVPDVPKEPEQPNPNPDPSDPTIPSGEHILGDATLIEVPRLKGGKNNYFITHRLSDGSVNYSVEYDVSKRHPRWSAFVFDDKTAQKNYTKRTDAWDWPTEIPRSFSTETWFSRSGYSRGHMVASSDRYFSKEANEQTFYYTNMSPQLQDHNGGVWNNIEVLVQNWGRNSKLRDVLYVVRGGTIEDHQIEAKKIRNIMVIPKYYYMAIVLKKGDKYQGIAFWTEHKKYTNTSLSSLTISIDELEKRTGIDFFHNLPDEIENTVEAQTLSSATWPGL